MLNSNESVVVRTTISNATHLAVAIASQVFGNTLSSELGGQELTRAMIGKVVLNDIRHQHMKKGVSRA